MVKFEHSFFTYTYVIMHGIKATSVSLWVARIDASVLNQLKASLQESHNKMLSIICTSVSLVRLDSLTPVSYSNEINNYAR